MKNKLIITLLALTTTAAMLAGCGKETAEVQTADTEAVAEVNTETETVAAETETEESTEGAELVYNTETDTEVVAKEDKTKSDKTDAKTDSTGSTKDSVSKTETKADSTKNDSATQAPAETPAETPAPEPAPAQNLCPYTLNQWLDLGDGWWGYYTCFQSPEGTVSALNKEFTDVIVTPDATWTYDDWGGELVGNYDDAKDVILTKFHMVPITNQIY